jgi:hypothetical protein
MQILPPSNTSPRPDRATVKGLNDYTGSSADNRVLHINLGFFKYGTHDKVHAAAVILSVALLSITIAVIYAGFSGQNAAWIDRVFSWSTSAFLFVAGIALGKGASSDNSKNGLD